MADIMPTHSHQNKLWALAYDDYPVNSVHQKEQWMNFGYQKKAWYTFYHDAYYRAIRFDETGEKIDEVERKRYAYKSRIAEQVRRYYLCRLYSASICNRYSLDS